MRTIVLLLLAGCALEVHRHEDGWKDASPPPEPVVTERCWLDANAEQWRADMAGAVMVNCTYVRFGVANYGCYPFTFNGLTIDVKGPPMQHMTCQVLDHDAAAQASLVGR